MKLQRFEVSNTPHLTVKSHGDLDISGGRKGEIAIKVYGREEDLQVVREGEHLKIVAHARCKIGCPRGTTVTLDDVQGDLRLRQLDGPMAVKQVQGDTVLKDVGPTIITNAVGDVRARSVRGELKLDSVTGDLRGSYLEGGLQATVGGDGSLTTDFVPDCDYRLSTGGDVVVKLPAQASARIRVKAGGDLKHKVDWADVQEEAGSLTGRLGDGEANVEINAGGDVSLRAKSDSATFVFGVAEDGDLEIELESMAEEIARNIEVYMANMGAQLEAKLGSIDQEAVLRKVEQSAEKARRKAAHAAERARIQAERAQRRWERTGAHQAGRHTHGAAAPRQTAPSVTDEERLMVLRMVQEGKITADEAAQLLEAMEG
jgi:hypothetical protein